MANVTHSSLTGADLHEPKGVSGATAGQVYVADGAGSGNWTTAQQYAGVYTKESDAVSVSSIGTTPQTFPFTNDGEENGANADAANNRITIGDAGVYMIVFHISFSTAAAGDAGLYEFKLMDDGVETGFASATYMSGSNDTQVVSTCALVSVGAGSHITIQLESDDAGNADDISVYTAKLSVFKVG